MSLALTEPVERRVQELVRDGYLTIFNGHPILTERGWRCLLASADSRLKEPLSKSS